MMCVCVCFGVHVCENKLGLYLASSDLTVHSWLLLYWLWEHQVPVNDSWCVEWASKHSFIEIPFPMVRAYTECHWVIHTGNKRIVIFNNPLNLCDFCIFPHFEFCSFLVSINKGYQSVPTFNNFHKNAIAPRIYCCMNIGT